MRHMLAFAASAMIAVSAPALAQTAGSPGAAGVGGGLSGSNTPGSGQDSQWSYSDNGWGDRGYDGPRTYGGPARDDYEPGYGRDEPGYRGPGIAQGPYGVEGRAAGWDYADHTPTTVRGDQNGQDDAD